MENNEELLMPVPPKPEKKEGFFKKFLHKHVLIPEEHEKDDTDENGFPKFNEEELDILSGSIPGDHKHTEELTELPSLDDIEDKELPEMFESQAETLELPDIPELPEEEISGEAEELQIEEPEEVESIDEEPGWAVTADEEKQEPMPAPHELPSLENYQDDIEKEFAQVAAEHDALDKELEKVIEQKIEPSRLEKHVPKEQYFWLHNGQAIRSFKELLEAMEYIDDETFAHHVSEHRNDFANWIQHVLSEEKLAEKVRNTTAKAELAKILRTHEKTAKKKDTALKKKETEIKKLESSIDDLKKRLQKKSADLTEWRGEAAKRVKDKMKEEADSLMVQHFGDLGRKELDLQKKEQSLVQKEETIMQQQKELQQALKNVEKHEVQVQKKETELDNARRELDLLRKEKKDLAVLVKEQKALDKELTIKKSKFNEMNALKERLKKHEEKLAHEQEEFKKFVQEEKEKLADQAKKLRLEYEKMYAELEEERAMYHEVLKAKDSIEVQKRLVEKEGYERYLKSKLVGTVAGEDEESLMPDVHKVKHIKVYNIIEDCRRALAEKDLVQAKRMYNQAKQEFGKSKLAPVEKHLLYNSLRELYDDIHLAALED